MEIAIPLSAVGSVDEGSQVTLRAVFQEPTGDITVEADRLPGTGPAAAVVPDLGTTTLVVDIVDPDNDDHGPGTYVYPQDAVFNAGNFDVQNFQVGFTENDIIFKFNLRGPIDNVWDSGTVFHCNHSMFTLIKMVMAAAVKRCCPAGTSHLQKGPAGITR